MSHFYANPLSIILAFMDKLDDLGELLTPLHIEAIRNVPSFKRYVEQKLNDRDVAEVRKLLGDDDHVRSTVIASAAGCRSYAVCIGQALTVLEIARSCQVNQNRIPRYELYAQVLSGELHSGTPLVRDLLLSMKKMNSTSLLNLLDKVTKEVQVPYLIEKVAPLRESIIALVEAAESSGKKTLNSEFNVTKDSLRATAVSKRIQLGEQKSALTKEDTEYSKLVQQVHDVAESYFKENLKGLQGLFLHELFFYDLISPHRDVRTHPSHRLVCGLAI
jgi:origin recognition complex subunit 3